MLRATQRSDGAWDGPCDTGPITTAQAVVALKHLGHLSAEDAAEAARWLRGQQRSDGSFVRYPTAKVGHLGATACAWAALHVTARDENAEAISKAQAFIDANGGTAGVVRAMREGDVSAVFLCLAGLLDPRKLQRPPMAFLGVPPLLKFLRTRFNSGVLLVAFELSTLIRVLRHEPMSPGDRLAHRAGLDLLTRFQNPDGSWNDNVANSALGAAALRATGAGAGDVRLQRAVRWLEGQAVRGHTGLHFYDFGSEVWATAFNVRALLDAGVAPSDPCVARALAWLASAQSTVPMPAVDNRQRGAVLTGGFAFQRSNPLMVDTDDTGVVLSALGMALHWSGPGALSSELESKLERTVRKAHDWLLGMQNPDGGWSAFIWGLPGKRPGAAMQQLPRLELDDPFALARALVEPPPALGDPSTEDVTARVLHGLGQTGFSARSEPVARALAFLQRQQCASGAFWGRWVLNYLSCTAFVLMGIKSVGADRDADWVRRAVRWVLSKQNADGGWGETPASYGDETKAGVGPSMAPLTALVLKALLDIGERSPATDRATAYLVKSQHSDGGWPNEGYLHVEIPPESFYEYAEATRFYPPSALGTWLRKGGAAPVVPPRYTSQQLEAMRQRADPPADAVVRELFGHGELPAVSRMLGQLFASDAALPDGLPDVVRAYFEQGGVLPAWADPSKLALAQQLFTREGWLIAAGLFCSSLPQAYCAANGARVLIQTQQMTKHVRRRVFETAQFLFDTCDDDALAPQGRGLATALKVRLMHAAIRHLVAAQPKGWDAARFGLPINQEDLAGTLMTFSVVILQALPRLGAAVSPDEADAWLHQWRVLGHVLGLHPDLLPGDVAEGEELMDLVRARQWERSDEGVVLARALVDLMQEAVPGRAFDGVPIALIRRLAGDHAADLLGLPRADWTTALINAGAALEALLELDDEAGRARMFAALSHRMMESLVLFEREGKQARFRMPRSLRKAKKSGG